MHSLANLAIRLARRAGRRIGRRGAYLLFLTLLDFTIGYSLTQPLPLGLTATVLYRPFVDWAPLSVWTGAWLVTGMLTLAGSVAVQIRPVVFALAALLKMAWAAGYLDGYLAGYPLYMRGYQTATIFAAFALVTLLIAGWRENGQ